MHRFSAFATILIFIGFGCGKSPPPIAGGKPVDHWIEASNDKNPKIRVEAIKKLGNIGNKDEEAMPIVFDALSDPVPAVRKEAIYAVVRNRKTSVDAVSALEEMKENDKDPEIRKLAEEAFRTLSGVK